MISNEDKVVLFCETDSVLRLKSLLSTDKALKTILRLVETAHDDESILLSLRLLAACLIKNDALMAIFAEQNAFKSFEELLQTKMLELHPQPIKRLLAQIIEIACDELFCSLRVDPSAT